MDGKGVIFVEELSEMLDGVPLSVISSAEERGFPTIDITCPLIAGVHQETFRHHTAGYLVLVIGKKNDPEVVGLLGHLPAKDCQVIGDTEAAQNVRIPLNQFLASITQTALSVKDTTQIIQVLRRRFPKLIEPRMDTICYATTNRQQAVRPIATKTAASRVLGSATSSNFTRLTEVAGQVSCKKVRLVSEPDELCLAWLNGVNVLGLTASASAPEYLVQRLIDRLVRRRSIKVEKIPVTKRKIPFRIPLRRFPKLSQISISRSAIKPQKHQEDFYQNKSSFSNQELHLA